MNTIDQSLAKNGVALVFFTHHRPKYADRDMRFFELAQGINLEDDSDDMSTRGVGKFEGTKVLEKFCGPMFEKDEGDVTVRSIVHGYQLKRKAT